jgi:hypothetical protein
MSVVFSSKGFGFEMGNELVWMGTLLAVMVTCMEIIWNHEARRMSAVMYAAGLLAYIYGAWANINGIISLRGGVDVLNDPMSLLLPLILGLFVELVPEPLLVWSITGRWFKGDFFTNVAHGIQGGGQIAQSFRQVTHAPPPQIHSSKGGGGDGARERYEQLQRKQAEAMRKAGMPEPPEGE